MRFLVAEKLGPHKFKTPEGYLICTDAILSRTGKQEYKRCEIFGDACDEPDKIVNVDRTDDEVFSDKAMASFENKPICIEHPDHDVNAENHNELAVGFIRDIHKGEDEGKSVMMGTLVITDKDAVEAVESGEYKELSCGYDCDIDDDDNPQQRNIRGNHVALCKHGRAGIARIVDSAFETIEAKKLAAGHKINFRGRKYVVVSVKKNELYNGELDIELDDNGSKRVIEAGERDKFVLLDSVDDAGIKVWQVRQGYAIVVKRYWQQYGKNAFVDATESSIEAARYHRGSLERNDKMDFVIIDCNDGKYKIEDSEMKDIQSTKAPGTDKIIYVMQSDIDKNLYFYIGKTFSMKEGAWGYTKFEMGNTTPEQLKAELSKNGWHAVSQGVARIIDAEHEVVTDEIMKDESRQTLIEKLRTVSVPYGERYALTSGSGWHIDIQHHGQASYENINKYPHASPKESSKATIRLWYNGKHMKTFEGPLNSAKSDAIRYLQTRTEDSWSSVEEENYNKANKPVGAKDETEKNFKIYVKNIFGAYKVADWPAVSKEAAVKEFLEMNPAYRNKGIIEARDSVSDSKKEQLFTIEYEQDGVMYVRKVKASNIQDAIRKVSDERLSPTTYRALKELGVGPNQWKNMSQEQASEYIAKHKSKQGEEKAEKKTSAQSASSMKSLAKEIETSHKKEDIEAYRSNVQKYLPDKSKIENYKDAKNALQEMLKKMGFEEDKDYVINKKIKMVGHGIEYPTVSALTLRAKPSSSLSEWYVASITENALNNVFKLKHSSINNSGWTYTFKLDK